MAHDFKSSLAKGAKGEELFSQLTNLTKLDGRRHDFVDKNTGDTYELKTDSYDADKTANFFIERYSDVERGKEGGPWQTLNNGSTYWVYLFPANNCYYKFKTTELVTELNRLLSVNTFRSVTIPNKGWDTVGFLIPRKLLEGIAEKVEYK